MADQTELTRQQMDETRASMTDKVEALEKQVSETVQETAATVADTVSTATETIDKTVETISSTVASVTETFDISGQIAKHPLLAFGGAVAVGYLVGALVSGRSSPAPAQPAPQAPEPEPTPEPATAEAAPGEADDRPGLADLFGNLKGLAIGTAVSVFGQVLLNSVPADMRSGLSGLVKDVTEYLGGTPQKQG